jgi:hypothetical protein
VFCHAKLLASWLRIAEYGAMNDTANQVHEQFSKYGKNAREWLHKCEMLLLEVERLYIWQRKGFGSIYEYAAKIASMSRSSVDEALRVLKNIADKPELLKIAKKKGVQRVRPVAAIATKETSAFWASKANDMSKNTLETYVRDYRREFLPNEKVLSEATALPGEELLSGAGLSSLKNEHSKPSLFLPREDFKTTAVTAKSRPLNLEKLNLKPEVAEKLLKLKGKQSWNELMEYLIDAHEQRLPKPETKVATSRQIPSKIKRYVLSRTNGQCAAPACTKSATSLHHTKRFALGKQHDPDTIQPLCTSHERIAHLGLIENEEQSPQNWKLLKKQDKNHPKYEIDHMVWLYRR